MPTDVAEVLKEALSLPVESRAALIDTLIQSLEVETDANSDELWREEIGRRLQQIDSDSVQLIPWADARHRLEDRLTR